MFFINDMNVSPISFNNSTVFKSYNEDAGYDDSFFQSIRNEIRRHYYKWHLPYHDVFEKEHRLTDYQIQTIIKDLETNHEMQKIEGSNNIYRGQTLVEKTNCLQAIKQKGIKTIIDLVGYGRTYEEAVKQAGMDYFVYNIYANWWDVTDFNASQMELLVKFLKKMQEGNIYIGCQHGANDTDVAFILNDFFNPLLEGKSKTKIPPSDSDFPIKLNSIYDLLTKEDKQLLGWTKEFEQKLIKKLISI